MPPLVLESSRGRVDLADLAAGLAVLYVYPAHGEARVTEPDEWNAIPGARGCTPQSCAFRDHAGRSALSGRPSPASRPSRSTSRSSLLGASACSVPVISDPELRLGSRSGCRRSSSARLDALPPRDADARDGAHRKTFYPVFPPDRNTEDVLDWLRAR